MCVFSLAPPPNPTTPHTTHPTPHTPHPTSHIPYLHTLTSTHTHILSLKVNNANGSGVTEGGYTYAIQYDDGDYEETVKVRG